eukprot:TRINITY_DN1311_c0_g4_i1.p1 TRINITY_DN1311_c0_g4~~TRINITY_DN1311_c0_g4_i1.p1  ORF type:complete len:430 (+),score=112.73 TRINITY_DN1311_c0_g4_i1:45-1334(+)
MADYILGYDFGESVVTWLALKAARAGKDAAVKYLEANGAPASGVMATLLPLIANIPLSACLENVLGWVCVVGGLVYWLLYKHFVRFVMARQASPFRPSVVLLMFATRPIQALFRIVTAPLRVAPDVLVIGQPRCGTTSLAHYIERMPGARQPFTNIRTAFVNNKESMYFIGIYLGCVHPMFYRMVFPTIFEKWYCQLLGKPFFAYDATPTDLTLSWTPRIIKQVNPNVKFIVCLREPVSQNVSWWNFDKQFRPMYAEMDCGKQVQWVPTTLREAWEMSLSDKVEQMYKDGEEFTGSFVPLLWTPMPMGYTQSMSQIDTARGVKNYLKHFPLSAFTFVDQKEDLSKKGVPETLRRIASALPDCVQSRVNDSVIDSIAKITIHSNASVLRCPSAMDEELIAEMKAYHAPRVAELEKLIGRKLNWKEYTIPE